VCVLSPDHSERRIAEPFLHPAQARASGDGGEDGLLRNDGRDAVRGGAEGEVRHEAALTNDFGVNAAISLHVAHGAPRRTQDAGGWAECQASFQFESQSLVGHSQFGVFPSGLAPQRPGPVAVPKLFGQWRSAILSSPARSSRTR